MMNMEKLTYLEEREDLDGDPGIIFIFNDTPTIHACIGLTSFATVTIITEVPPLVQGKKY